MHKYTQIDSVYALLLNARSDDICSSVTCPPPPTQRVSWTSFVSVPVDPSCRLHVCVMCPDCLVYGSASCSFPPFRSPQPIEREVFPIVLLINIPAVNIYGLLSSHSSFLHILQMLFKCELYTSPILRTGVRTTYRTALVSPCS